MEQTNENQPTKAGKGASIGGFVISLVAIVGWLFVSAAALFAAVLGGGTGLAIGWAVFTLIGVVLSVMGFMAAKKGNGKKGLAIAGLIIGLLAFLLSVRTVFGVMEVKSKIGDSVSTEFNDGLEKLQQYSDSVKTANGE